METPICQIALSVVDLARSRSWYRQLGLEPSGVMGPLSGDLPARMLDLPELEVQINWLLGRDSMSQLELIHFSRPQPRPRAKTMQGTESSVSLSPTSKRYCASCAARTRRTRSPELRVAGRFGSKIRMQFRWRSWRRIRWV